jgi:hypothetical protein
MHAHVADVEEEGPPGMAEIEIQGRVAEHAVHERGGEDGTH